MSPFGHRRHARELALAVLCLAEADEAVYDSMMETGRGAEDDLDVMPGKVALDTLFGDALAAFQDVELRAEYYEDEEPSLEELDADEIFIGFARAQAEGAWADRAELDALIAPFVRGYAYDRLARVDRNSLRLATWELLNLDYLGPAVSIAEWVEISRRFSSRETGRFVNGVLGSVVKETPKASFDRATAPSDPYAGRLAEIRARRAPIEPSVTVTEDSEEGKTVRRYGWILRSGDAEIPSNEGP